MISKNELTKIVNEAYGEMEGIIKKISSSGTYWINDQYMIYGYLADDDGEDDMWIHLSVERDGKIFFEFETYTENDTSESNLKKAVEECIKWFYNQW